VAWNKTHVLFFEDFSGSMRSLLGAKPVLGRFVFIWLLLWFKDWWIFRRRCGFHFAFMEIPKSSQLDKRMQ